MFGTLFCFPLTENGANTSNRACFQVNVVVSAGCDVFFSHMLTCSFLLTSVQGLHTVKLSSKETRWLGYSCFSQSFQGFARFRLVLNVSMLSSFEASAVNLDISNWYFFRTTITLTVEKLSPLSDCCQFARATWSHTFFFFFSVLILCQNNYLFSRNQTPHLLFLAHINHRWMLSSRVGW